MERTFYLDMTAYYTRAFLSSVLDTPSLRSGAAVESNFAGESVSQIRRTWCNLSMIPK